MAALLVLALAMAMIVGGDVMDAKPLHRSIVKNALVPGGIVAVPAFATLIVGP